MITWDDLYEKAKQLGYKHYKDKDLEWLTKGHSFWSNGTICIFDGKNIVDFHNKKPEQLLKIMEALEDVADD